MFILCVGSKHPPPLGVGGEHAYRAGGGRRPRGALAARRQRARRARRVRRQRGRQRRAPRARAHAARLGTRAQDHLVSSTLACSMITTLAHCRVALQQTYSVMFLWLVQV